MNHSNSPLLKTVQAGFTITALLLAVACGDTKGTLVNNPRNPNGLGPAPITLSADGGVLQASDLGSAGNYVILAKTGVSNVTGSAIVGNLGVSPAAGSYYTGFPSFAADPGFTFATSSAVTGRMYAANYFAPTASNLTTAIGSMETAYTNAAGRSNPDFNELATGNLSGLTLTPGLYTWSSSVTMPTNLTLAGGTNDVWIFQIAGNLTMAAAKTMTLTGGAQAKNVFWQVAGSMTVGTSSHFEGIILCKTAVTFQTTSSLTGRIFSQTMVALDNNAITQQ